MSITEKADLTGLRIDRDRIDTSGPKTTRKAIIVAGVVLALSLLGYFGYTSFLASPTEVDAATVTMTYPSSANAVLTASGYIVAQQKASIASKATGRLVYLGVEEGDRVKKGQIIARIEEQDVQAALAQARANYELSKADYDDARLWVGRMRTMQATGTTSKSELDAAEARFKRVEASIKSAAASVTAAEVALENTRIRAPFDGTVLTKNANVGEVVAPFAAAAGSRAAVVTIADMSSLEVEADVSESNITRVEPGAPCEIVLDAYPSVRYQGVVHKIVPTADRAKATVLTKVRFIDRDERVLPEMRAKVTFLSRAMDEAEAKAAPSLTIPASSITQRDGSSAVLVIKDDVIEVRSVRTGDRVGERIAVVEGLTQGEKVVLRPDPALTAGSKVRIK